MNILCRKFLFVLIMVFVYTPAFSANNSKADSLFKEGKKYYDKEDYFRAVPLIKKAAEMGHSDAQMHLGKMYYNGWGIKHNHHTALKWHKKAAAQGNIESQKKLKEYTHEGQNKSGSNPCHP